ncbi:MAG: RtcB family protein [Oscillospiraceae bacterium]|nr:RtcB family protein [Oscillospiraceae bacterium]
MIELRGKYNTATVFTDSAEQYAIAQIINLLNQEFTSGSKIRIMPDTHAGTGCTIGTTMTITDKVVPNLVGVDIGCGMETVLLRDTRVELQQLDKAIHKLIPAGFAVRKTQHTYASEIDLTALRCSKHVKHDRALASIGTLGGGNHFIELDRDDDGRLYLVIHTGSRYLGKQVAEYYQNAAADALKAKNGSTDRALAYAEGALFDDYLHDMAIVQQYADLNRAAIARDIIKEMKLKVDERFSTVHNYIDLDSMILRKGAISAKENERVLIPMNMRDGSLICKGKGNPDWNSSAPHGAGRLMSRSDAKQSITLTQFEKSMAGIYSSTVNKSTIDESPFAYKPMDEIIANIGDTAEIVKTIKPVYNFKSAE